MIRTRGVPIVAGIATIGTPPEWAERMSCIAWHAEVGGHQGWARGTPTCDLPNRSDMAVLRRLPRGGSEAGVVASAVLRRVPLGRGWRSDWRSSAVRVNGGRIPGHRGGVKAGHWRWGAADMARAPIGALAISAVGIDQGMISPVSRSALSGVAWFCSAAAVARRRPADCLRR